MNAEHHEPPDWVKWQQMISAPLWKLVALSLGIEPDQFRLPPVIKVNIIESISNEFHSRLAVACNCLANNELRRVNMRVINLNVHCIEVKIADFLAWANDKEWKLPHEFLNCLNGSACEGKNVKSTIACESECINWLKKLMMSGPPSKARDEYLKEAQKKFGIGVRSSQRAWDAAKRDVGPELATPWQKPGPRS